MKRKIINIDEEKCTGCGLCVNACAEGAIKMVDGKAKLVSDIYCDGLGACIGECPYGAISIEEREAKEFDEKAVKKMLAKKGAPADARLGGAHAGCPGMKALSFSPAQKEAGNKPVSGNLSLAQSALAQSELAQWPIQLHLVPENAPYWDGADILLAADCSAFSFGAFHSQFLAGKKLIIACPKLDDSDGYVEKLAAIISGNDVKSITAVRMEVPCCGGIANFAREARRISGKDIPLKVVVLGIDGSIKSEEEDE